MHHMGRKNFSICFWKIRIKNYEDDHWKVYAEKGNCRCANTVHLPNKKNNNYRKQIKLGRRPK